MNDQKDEVPTKEWWDLMLAPPVDCRKKYDDALEFTSYERLLTQQIKGKNNG
jgi:hypothetical protein